MDSTINEFNEDKDLFCQKILLWMLFIPLLNEFVVPATKYFIGESVGEKISLLIYGICFVYAVWNIAFKYHLLSYGKLMLYCNIIAIFMLSKMIHPAREKYYTGTDIQLLKMFFLPISIFAVTSIRNWNSFDEIAYKFSKWACVVSCLKLLLDGLETTKYMTFSYALLPFVGMTAYSAINGKRSGLLPWIILSVDIVVMMAFGARSPVLFIALIIFGLILLNDSSAKKLGLIALCLIATFVVYYNLDSIIHMMSGSAIFEDSYFLDNLVKGNLLESKSRELIYETCRNYISEMGFELNGFFYDRILLKGIGAYAHNIVYDIMLSFGWCVGLLILIVMSYAIISTFIKTTNVCRGLLFMFFVTLMARFFISGSYVVEFRFYIFFCILYSMSKCKRHKEVQEVGSLMYGGKI